MGSLKVSLPTLMTLVYGVCYSLPKRPINQFEPAQQSRKQALRAYCPNLYTVPTYLECVLKMKSSSFRSLVFIKACFGYLGIQIVAKSRPFFRGPAVVSRQIMCFWPSFGAQCLTVSRRKYVKYSTFKKKCSWLKLQVTCAIDMSTKKSVQSFNISYSYESSSN